MDIARGRRRSQGLLRLRYLTTSLSGNNFAALGRWEYERFLHFATDYRLEMGTRYGEAIVSFCSDVKFAGRQ